jgi:hypothetical protein
MPVTTYTASEINPLKQLHAGLNCVRSTVTITPTTSSLGTLTVSSIVYMAKIPAGAILVDGYMSGGESSGGEGTWNLGIRKGDGGTTFPVNNITGTSVSDNSLLTAVTISDGALWRFGAVAGTRIGIPYYVSVSEGDPYQYHWLVATAITGSGTATTSLHLIAMYLSNNNS